MIESTSKILLCSNHNDQWAHYRNGRNIYPKIRAPTGGTVIGYPVKVSITPTGYKIIETNIRQLPNIYHQILLPKVYFQMSTFKLYLPKSTSKSLLPKVLFHKSTSKNLLPKVFYPKVPLFTKKLLIKF